MSYRNKIQKMYDINEDQLDAVLFLTSLDDNYISAPDTDNLDQIITTHCAHIILTKTKAFKIKRSVKYTYLDMLALDSREQLCKRELEINQPSLPGVYLEVLPIKKGDDGVLTLNGNGDVVEWVLIMEKFPQCRVLDSMAKSGNFSVELASQVGASISRYHRGLPSEYVVDGFERMNEIVDELIEELAHPNCGFDFDLLQRFGQVGKDSAQVQKELLNTRARDGYIKRCHGDLHLRNLVLMEDGPHPFDALEFDERLATIDVLYDLAFVLMDMQHRGLEDQRSKLLNQYLAHCEPKDLKGLALLPFFLFCRAGILAMTTSQKNRNNSSPSNEAIEYLKLALSYLEPKESKLIAIGGYSGSGKSTIAAKLAVRLNAVLLSSDIERKAQLNIAETQRLPASSYTSKAAHVNYERLAEKARCALSANQLVIVDATFLSSEQRKHIESLALECHVPFVGIWLDVSKKILETRIRDRRNDASDATVDVLQKQLEKPLENIQWNKVNASGSIDSTLSQILTILDKPKKCNDGLVA